MAISKKISEFMDQSSWIRRMFEEGIRLKREHGEENVFDLSLGNPVVEPPGALKQALVEAAQDPSPGRHRYMPNAGYPEVRAAVAEALAPECKIELTANDVVMTCGAAGGLNIALKAILDPGDEVLVFTPYFVEYLFYVDNHGGKAVPVGTYDDFTLNFKKLAAAFTRRTKAVIINSPNNPTGVVYSPASIQELANLLKAQSEKQGRAIYLISDDPYKKIVFDGVETPNICRYYDHSIYISSHSKDLAVPGERIGFVVVHPRCEDGENLMAGLVFCNRVLGFVNAPALIQRAVQKVQHVTVNVEDYQRKRDFLYEELSQMGYSVVRPQGAFYLFPQSPLADEVEFVRLLATHRVLAVPGRGFGLPGYFRLSYCVPDAVIEGAIPGFEKALRSANIK